MENQNVTIEDLARMIKQGFDETAKKQEMDERFNAVDEKFNAVDEKFDVIDKRFNAVEERFDTIDVRFDIVEGRLERIEGLLLGDHRRRIEKLEYEIKELKGLLNVG